MYKLFSLSHVRLDSISSTGLGSFLISICAHVGLALGIIAIGSSTRGKELQDNLTEQVHWVKLDKLAEQSQAPSPAKVSKHLQLATSKAKVEQAKPQRISQINKRVIVKQPVTQQTFSNNRPLNNVASSSTLNAPTDAGSQGSAAVSTAAKSGPARASYEQALLQKLEQAKSYPTKALRRRLEGDVLLSLSVAASGRVLNFSIQDSSGFEFFDEEVLAMVKRVGVFPPFPEDISVSKLDFQVPVSFEFAQ